MLQKRHAVICYFIGLLLTASCGSGSKNSGVSPSPSSDGGAAAGTGEESTLSSNKIFGIKWTWDSKPRAETPASAVFQVVTPEGGTPESVTDIGIDPWMPSMGHGTFKDDQKITQVTSSPSTYRIDGLYFIMGGPWEIRVSATVNGSKDQAGIKVDIE